MLTALIIATAATVLILTATILAALTGWFPRLATLTAQALALLLRRSEKPRLDRRDRAELAARLWVP